MQYSSGESRPSKEMKIMAKYGVLVVSAGVALLGVFFPGKGVWAASCDEECAVSKSCASYSECKTAHVQCLASCKEKEAWEIAALAYEKTAQAQTELVKHLENQNVALEKLLMLIDSLIIKISRIGVQGEAPAGEVAVQPQAVPGK
jgi:hypothetical protein